MATPDELTPERLTAEEFKALVKQAGLTLSDSEVSELKERYEFTRDGIVIIDSTFIPNVNKELTGTPNSGVEFLIENRTPFNLQDIPFNVIISNGINLTAANRATVSRLDRGEQRLIRTRWFRIVGAGEVIIEPDINYLDDFVIAPFIEDTIDASL